MLACPSAARANPVGTVFSGPTDGDGASIFWNPAAMSLLEKSDLQIVANLFLAQASYQRDGIDSQTGGAFPRVSLLAPRPEPVIALVIDKLWHRHLRLGLALSIPSVDGAAWPETVTLADGTTILGPTRYHVTNATLANIYGQIGASVRLHRVISLGFALNLVGTYLSSSKHLDLLNQEPLRSMVPCASNPFGCENPMFSAPTEVHGSGFSVGASFGVLVEPVPRLRIGLSYQTPVKMSVNATIAVDTSKLEAFARQYFPSLMPLAVNGNATIAITIPQRVHAAVAVDVHPKVELQAGFHWINAKAANLYVGVLTQKTSTLLPDTVPSAFVRSDQLNFNFRTLYRISPRWKAAVQLLYEPAAVPDDFLAPNNVDFSALTITLGGHVLVWKTLGIGATFSQVVAFSRDAATTSFGNDRAVPFNLPDPSGHYDANAERVGLDLDYLF
jgi:long-subunit fatty acid transport protein